MTAYCIKREIYEGDTYYLLGGGKVVNCVDCACHHPFIVTVGKDQIQLTRAWHKTAVADRVQKVL